MVNIINAILNILINIPLRVNDRTLSISSSPIPLFHVMRIQVICFVYIFYIFQISAYSWNTAGSAASSICTPCFSTSTS